MIIHELTLRNGFHAGPTGWLRMHLIAQPTIMGRNDS